MHEGGSTPIGSCHRQESDSHPGKQVWAELRGAGRIVQHPVFPEKEGPAARRIEDEADVRDVIELMRLNYDRVVARYGVPAAA